MNYSEEQVLDKVFWPRDKMSFLGNLSFTTTNSDFTETKEIYASRQNDSLEIFYSTAPVQEIDNKNYLVKLYFTRDAEGLTVNQLKSSPELKTVEDINNVLDSVQMSILLINAKPNFFPTNVIENKNSLNPKI